MAGARAFLDQRAASLSPAGAAATAGPPQDAAVTPGQHLLLPTPFWKVPRESTGGKGLLFAGSGTTDEPQPLRFLISTSGTGSVKMDIKCTD